MFLLGSSLLVIVFWSSSSFCHQQWPNLARNQIPFIANLVPTAFSPQVSPICLNDSLSLLDSITRSEPWALKMLDASGKLSDMYVNVNKHVMGHYDQCLSVVASQFVGKYCTVFIQDHFSPLSTEVKHEDHLIQLLRSAPIFGVNTENNTKAEGFHGEPEVTSTRNFYQSRLALCVPSTCLASDVGRAISHLLRIQLEGNLSSITVATEEDFCYTATQTSELDVTDTIVGAAFSTLAAFILAGTLIECWNMHRDEQLRNKLTKHELVEISKPVRIILCFSLITNMRRLFYNHTSKDGVLLSCVFGIRFLLMSWVILGHSWIQGIILYNQNSEGLQQDGRKWQWQAIVNGTISVDGFFLLSGLLVSFHFLQHLERSKGKLNLTAFYIHRYIRLTPVYLAIFAYVSTLLVHSGSGPSWFSVKFTAANCRQVWWQQFLFINNFIPRDADKQCMSETWFLANELQLFLVSPLLIYPIWRWKRKGLIILAVVTFFALTGNVAIFYIKNMPPTSMLTRPVSMSKSLVDFWVYYYPQPWFRSPPYLVGIFLGYLLNEIQIRPMQIPKVVEISGWLLSFFTVLLVIYGLFPFADEDKIPQIHPAVNVLYGSFHRFAWAIALSWIIFSCCCGKGGFINDFLSWPIFVPLGKLSYCTYLIHYNVIQVYYAHKRQAPYYTAIEQFYLVFGNLAVSTLLAMVTCLAVEFPFINLECTVRQKIGTQYLPSTLRYCASRKKENGKINQAFSIT